MITSSKQRARESRNKIISVSKELKEISDALEASDAVFNEISDGDLIDAIIFERSALRARYSFLLKELRRLESDEPKIR